ncbi:cell division protein ZipA [Haemophilus influenzae]|uniref:cell division protein ZipA n=1 Tax=Haemophilus influenzae TaxID=727 RepID=UPI0010C439C0|nr:cell division protein ZipA [Haemophilus influenzae]VTP78320.1 cell division protein ZipA [Haemophilus influenzae]
MDLNTILIIMGIVVLVALILHGLWSNRREKSKYFDKANKFDRTSPTSKSHTQEEMVQPNNISPNTYVENRHTPITQPTTEKAPSEAELIDYRQSDKSLDDIKISIPNAQPIYDMGNHRSETTQPTQPQYDMPTSNNVASMTLEQLEAQSQNVDFNGINSSSPELRVQLAELSHEERQIDYNISFNEPKAETTAQPKQTTGYIQLYLIPKSSEEFNGAKLVQALENLGFILGKDEMYHRHLDLSVASPVLFSVANLEQPGTFNTYNLAEFNTIGIVFFMQLPSPGNNLANLRMMMRAAHTLAEDLQGVILTEEQEIFDANAEQAYLARV